jgi:hypothetical protein
VEAGTIVVGGGFGAFDAVCYILPPMLRSFRRGECRKRLYKLPKNSFHFLDFLFTVVRAVGVILTKAKGLPSVIQPKNVPAKQDRPAEKYADEIKLKY